MYITKIDIRNFRLLKKSILDLNSEDCYALSLFIGRNNTGKTSFIVLFEKFFTTNQFNFYDFPLSLRKQLLSFDKNTNIEDLLIQLIVEIKYSDQDNLENLSDFILDLDIEKKDIKILFECSIDKNKLLSDINNISVNNRKKFIEKNLSNYLIKHVFSFETEEDLLKENRSKKLVPRNLKQVKELINVQIIHAKRNVASSESDGLRKAPLSSLTTEYFNKNNPSLNDEDFNSVNEAILKMDIGLNEKYEAFFFGLLENARRILNLPTLRVTSDLESKQIVSNFSKVIYGDIDNYLPEKLNGLGCLNILYLLIQIEIKKKLFQESGRDINLLFIEEPEAHTHPQMQYIFIKEIKSMLNKINNLQTFISTHSSHITSQCDFKCVRYFRVEPNNIIIKNFYTELEKQYSKEQEYFKFLQQYLTLYSAELFFAEKIIFIEGISEKILLPLFIKQIDQKNSTQENYQPIGAQNITIIEVGANAKVFRHFLKFLGIKTLIITDIDTTKSEQKEEGQRVVYRACEVSKGDNISNETLKYYFQAPTSLIPDEFTGKSSNNKNNFKKWFNSLINHKINLKNINIHIAYQNKFNDYYARSFEDSFIYENIQLIIKYKDDLKGLKNKDKIGNNITDFYELSKNIVKSKSEFASSILYLALVKKVEWQIPNYIEIGLEWLQNEL